MNDKIAHIQEKDIDSKPDFSEEGSEVSDHLSFSLWKTHSLSAGKNMPSWETVNFFRDMVRWQNGKNLTKIREDFKYKIFLQKILVFVKMAYGWHNLQKTEICWRAKMYSTYRKNKRLPLTLFFQLLDFVGINTLIIRGRNGLVTEKKRMYLPLFGLGLEKQYSKRRDTIIKLRRKFKRIIRDHLLRYKRQNQWIKHKRPRMRWKLQNMSRWKKKAIEDTLHNLQGSNYIHLQWMLPWQRNWWQRKFNYNYIVTRFVILLLRLQCLINFWNRD